MTTIKQLAQEALAVQDACNPLGLSKGYASALQELHDALAAAGQPCGTDDLWRHPINKLWAAKMHEASGMGLSDTKRYFAAYEACKLLAE